MAIRELGMVIRGIDGVAVDLEKSARPGRGQQSPAQHYRVHGFVTYSTPLVGSGLTGAGACGEVAGLPLP